MMCSLSLWCHGARVLCRSSCIILSLLAFLSCCIHSWQPCHTTRRDAVLAAHCAQGTRCDLVILR